MRDQQQDQRSALKQVSLLPDTLACAFGAAGSCPTCSDAALPARVLNIEEETGLALVEIEGTTTEIDVTLVDAVAPGDWLLTHGGVAIGRLEERR